MKVYCKNCKWFVLFYDYYGCCEEYCNACTGKIITDYIHGDYKERVCILVGANGYLNNKVTNGCKLYKRKWWKFWIKVKSSNLQPQIVRGGGMNKGGINDPPKTPKPAFAPKGQGIKNKDKK